MSKFLSKSEEYQLMWESYQSQKDIVPEYKDFNSWLIDIFTKYGNDPDPYPKIGEELRRNGVDRNDIDEIKDAVRYVGDADIMSPEPPVYIDSEAVLEQIGVGGGNDEWEHDELYGQDY